MNERPVRFENYDVLSKRDSVSWNDVTRDVVLENVNPTIVPRKPSRAPREKSA